MTKLVYLTLIFVVATTAVATSQVNKQVRKYSKAKGKPTVGPPMRVWNIGPKMYGSNYFDLYVSYDSGKLWYIEAKFEKPIYALNITPSGEPVIFDGQKSLLYNFQSKSLSEYKYVHPLSRILSTPIKTVVVKSRAIGCLAGSEDVIKYCLLKEHDPDLQATEYRTQQVFDFETKLHDTSGYSLSKNRIQRLLLEIDSQPYKVSSMKELSITPMDRAEYCQLVYSTMKEHRLVDSEFYMNVAHTADTIGPDIMYKILSFNNGDISTSSYQYSIILVNETNDTLEVSSRYFAGEMSKEHYQWTIKCDSAMFSSYNYNIVKFVYACTPASFCDKTSFSNKYFFVKLEKYLRATNNKGK